MARAIGGLVGGLVAWFLIATAGNLALRLAWAGYAEVEKAMTFTLAMMVARLVLGALSSLGAGLTVAWITAAMAAWPRYWRAFCSSCSSRCITRCGTGFRSGTI